MDAELVVTPPGCSHLSSFKVDNWKQNLRAIYQCFVWSGTAEARKRKVTPLPASPRPGTAGWAGGRRRPLSLQRCLARAGGGASGPCGGREGEVRDGSLACRGPSPGCARRERGGHQSILLFFHSPPPPPTPSTSSPAASPFSRVPVLLAAGLGTEQGRGLGSVSNFGDGRVRVW